MSGVMSYEALSKMDSMTDEHGTKYKVVLVSEIKELGIHPHTHCTFCAERTKADTCIIQLEEDWTCLACPECERFVWYRREKYE